MCGVKQESKIRYPQDSHIRSTRNYVFGVRNAQKLGEMRQEKDEGRRQAKKKILGPVDKDLTLTLLNLTFYFNTLKYSIFYHP